MVMKEIWKDIKGYEGLYQISNFGNIKSLRTNKLVKAFKNTKGYCQVSLWNNNVKKMFVVHRLVAQEFIPNPNNLLQVNHKDEDKKNNNVDNLEWCSVKYNCNYGTRNIRLSSPVICVELNKRFNSINDASNELNIQQAHISGCCAKRKHYKTAGGFHWQYVEEG